MMRDDRNWPSSLDQPRTINPGAYDARIQRYAWVLLFIAGLIVLGTAVLVVAPAHAQDVEVFGANVVLQAAAQANGPGSPWSTIGRRYKTVSVQIGGVASTHLECSVDGGHSFNKVLDTTLTEADACNAPPDACLLDVPVSCTHIRAPITGCSGCIVTIKAYAE